MENFEFDTEEMEMPTPCEHCGSIFDLNDGYGSEKWHPNIVICEKCHEDEEAEIEEDERWDSINTEISNAFYGLDKEEGAWEKLDKENQALIIRLVRLSLIDKVREITFSDGSAQKRMVDINELFSNEA